LINHLYSHSLDGILHFPFCLCILRNDLEKHFLCKQINLWHKHMIVYISRQQQSANVNKQNKHMTCPGAYRFVLGNQCQSVLFVAIWPLPQSAERGFWRHLPVFQYCLNWFMSLLSFQFRTFIRDLQRLLYHAIPIYGLNK